MKTSKTPIVPAVAILALLLCNPSHAAPAPDPLSQANNAFAVDFYKSAATQPGNFAFSPYSISAAFAMTYAGASGQTASQMQKTFHWTDAASKVAADFAALDRSLVAPQKEPGVQIAIANALWPQKGYRFRQEYLQILGDSFKTSLHEADFRNQAEAERSRINQLVEKQTHDRIKDLMPPGSVSQRTRLVLANAIWFKAKWLTPFQTSATEPAPFYLPSGSSVTAQLMKKTSFFEFVALPTCKLLSMPYQGREYSMVIALPDATNGLPQLESELSTAKLTEWLGFLRNKQVSVFVPRFTLNFQLKLNDTLAALGMPDAFNEQAADFSGMTGARDLFISAAMHKAFVEVNEEGTEAAAATGISIAPTSAVRPVEIPTFRADHPFLYLIRHNPTGTILFLGRLNDPSKS